jgi:hypothetical protein
MFDEDFNLENLFEVEGLDKIQEKHEFKQDLAISCEMLFQDRL